MSLTEDDHVLFLYFDYFGGDLQIYFEIPFRKYFRHSFLRKRSSTTKVNQFSLTLAVEF